MIKENPYFMKNEKWYVYNNIENRYELTDEASLRAIESYYDFYSSMDKHNKTEFNLPTQQDKINEFKKYLKNNFNDVDIIEILQELVIKSLIPYEYLSDIIESDIEKKDSSEIGSFLYSLDFDFIMPIIKQKQIFTRIEEMDFSTRTYNALINKGISNLSDLIMMSYDDIIKFKNIGEISIKEIVSFLETNCSKFINENMSIDWISLSSLAKNELKMNSIYYVKDICKMTCKEFVYNSTLSKITIKNVVELFVINELMFRVDKYNSYEVKKYSKINDTQMRFENENQKLFESESKDNSIGYDNHIDFIDDNIINFFNKFKK